MISNQAMPTSVEGLYQQLACERAEAARAALAQEVSVERLFAESAQALEDAAAVLLHSRTAFASTARSLPALFGLQAGALLMLAARFEQAADLSGSEHRRTGSGDDRA